LKIGPNFFSKTVLGIQQKTEADTTGEAYIVPIGEFPLTQPGSVAITPGGTQPQTPYGTFGCPKGFDDEM